MTSTDDDMLKPPIRTRTMPACGGAWPHSRPELNRGTGAGQRGGRAAQERAYWLERWHIDLNALMRKPGAREFRAILRAVRAVARQGRKLKRRLRT